MTDQEKTMITSEMNEIIENINTANRIEFRIWEKLLKKSSLDEFEIQEIADTLLSAAYLTSRSILKYNKEFGEHKTAES